MYLNKHTQNSKRYGVAHSVGSHKRREKKHRKLLHLLLHEGGVNHVSTRVSRCVLYGTYTPTMSNPYIQLHELISHSTEIQKLLPTSTTAQSYSSPEWEAGSIG